MSDAEYDSIVREVQEVQRHRYAVLQIGPKKFAVGKRSIVLGDSGHLSWSIMPGFEKCSHEEAVRAVLSLNCGKQTEVSVEVQDSTGQGRPSNQESTQHCSDNGESS